MLGKILLIVLQIVVAWFLGPIIVGQVAIPGEFQLFFYALVFAVIVFVTGLLASMVLKDVGTPSSGTLTAAIVVALLAALLAKFGPTYIPELHTIAQRNIVLAGAILGYLIRR